MRGIAAISKKENFNIWGGFSGPIEILLIFGGLDGSNEENMEKKHKEEVLY